MNKQTQHLGRAFLLTFIAALCLCASARADIATGLLSYFKLDDGSGTSALDVKGYSPAAVLNGFAGTEWVANGRTNGALRFSGSAQYATIDDSTNGLNFARLANPSFTLATWVRGTPGVSQASGAGLITRGYGSGGEQFLLDIYQNAFRFGVRNNAGTGSTLQLTPAATNTLSGVWQHVTAVFDAAGGANNMKLYLNGVLIGQMTGPTTLYDVYHDVSLGAREANSYSGYNFCFNGMMDDVRIYNRALSASDVTELYQAPGAMAPSIYVQPTPAALSLHVGDAFSFSVNADGAAPLSYQWTKNSADIANATNATYSLANLQLADAGTYAVVITNAVGSITSSNCVVSVDDPPVDITSGLVSYFTLDQSGGSTALDAVGGTSGATIQNFTSDARWLPSGGRTNGGYSFTGLTDPLNPVSGQYAEISDPSSVLDFSSMTTPALTVAAWIKTPPGFSEPDGVGLVAKGYGRGGEQYVLDLYANGPRFFVKDPAGGSYDARADIGGPLGAAAITVNNGAWTHLVGVLDPTVSPTRVKLFINGQLIDSASGPASLMGSTGNTTIGARQDSNISGYNLPFTGLMDDVRIYNRALSPSDVKALYASVGTAPPSIVVPVVNTTNWLLSASTLSVTADGTVPLSYQWRWYGTNLPNATNFTYTIAVSQLSNAGPYSVVVTNLYGSVTSSAYLAIVDLEPTNITAALVAQWNFEDGSGTTAADSSGRGNNLDLVNFPTDNSQWVSNARVGNKALRFNSLSDPGYTNDYCRTPYPLVLPYNSNLFTFTFWIRLDYAGSATYPRIISPEYAGVANQHWILWKSSATIGTGFYTPVASPVPAANVWKHFVVTYDRGINRYSMWVDGVKSLNNIAPSHAKNIPNPYWVLGHNENTAADADWFRGELDDVRIYNRVLTDTQIAYLYTNTPPFLYITTQPQPASGVERDQAAFTVAAEGTAPLSYQWAKDGVDIPGATAATYTIPYVTLAMNGSTYRVRVTNPAGFRDSAPATLSVGTLAAGADLTNNLVLHYTFDWLDGDIAPDSSSHHNDGVLYNWAPGAAKLESGVLSNALHFNGGPFISPATNNNYVLTPGIGVAQGLANGDNFTFTFWAKRDTNTIYGNPRVFATANDKSWAMWRPGYGIGFWNGAWAAPEPSVTDWHHYVVSFDRVASRYTIYVDGVRKVFRGIPTNPATESDPTDYQWVIGHRENITPENNTESFRGWLDDVRMYNRQLTIYDAEALYQAANVPPVLSMQANGSTLTFSWPSWAVGYTLKYSNSLAPGAPMSVAPGSPVLVDAMMYQTNTIGSDTKFFRLVK